MYSWNSSWSIYPVLASFNLQITNILPRRQDFLIETDRGIKRLLFWDHLEFLLFSHHWREKLAENGYRFVERFYQTRYGAPYVSAGAGGYTLSDWIDGPPADVRSAAGLKKLAQVHALIHKAADAPSITVNRSFIYREIARRLEKDKQEAEAVIPAKLGQTNRTAVLQRIKYGEDRLQKLLAEGRKLPLSVSWFMPENLIQWEDEWYVTGLEQARPWLIHHDTAQLLKRIYAENGQDLKSVYSYLNAYQEVRRMDRGESGMLLAYLLYPGEILQAISTPWQNESEGQYELIQSVFHRQGMWDELAEGVSEWIKSNIS